METAQKGKFLAKEIYKLKTGHQGYLQKTSTRLLSSDNVPDHVPVTGSSIEVYGDHGVHVTVFAMFNGQVCTVRRCARWRSNISVKELLVFSQCFLSTDGNVGFSGVI